MISAQLDFSKMKKKMDNLAAYSIGFVEGAQAAKPQMLNRLGEQVSELIGQYIDSIASANPSALHHVYEWGRTGSSASRLFDIDYLVSGGGLSLNATFSQSTSVQAGSSTPFYNKAYIMENGLPVRIKPKTAQALSFMENGEQVFTKKEVVVVKPGGEAVAGSFEKTFDDVVRVYLSQAIFDVTDVGISVKNVRIFKDNLKQGAAGGRSVGVATGKRWITGGIV
jgi:hypothetical protein